MSWKEAIADLIGKRDDVDVLVNDGVEIVVGGAGTSQKKTVLLREPSMARFSKHVKGIVSGVRLAYKELGGDELLGSVVPDLKAGKTPTMPDAGALLRARPVVDALSDLIADLVGEDRSYVENEMTPKQVGKILKTYALLVGWETIQRFFVQALTRGTEYAEKMATETAATTAQ
jgi:hypothetical protein